MIRDLAEETVDGSAFDDFRCSSMLAIIGRQVGVMSNWFVQSPNIYEILQKKHIDGSETILMISVHETSLIGIAYHINTYKDRLGLCLIGLFKVPMIRDLAEETVDGSAFDDFSASSMLAIIGRQVGVMSNWFVQSPNDTRSCRRNS